MNWSNFSFRSKILICFLLLVFLLSGFSLVLSYFLTDISDLSHSLVYQSVPELLILSHWNKEIHVKRMVLEHFLNRQTFLFMQKFYNDDLHEEWVMKTDSLPENLQYIRREMDRLDFTYQNKINGLLKYNNVEMAETIILEELYPDLLTVEAMIGEEYASRYQLLAKQSNAISTKITTILLSLFFISSIAILLSIYFSYRLSLGLTKPVDTLIHKVGYISQGAYGLQIPSLGQYELQRLVHSINEMSASLEESFTTLFKEKLFREQILASIPIGIIIEYDEGIEREVNDKALELIGVSKNRLDQLISDPLFMKDNEEFWYLFHSKTFFQFRKIAFYSSKEQYQFLVSQTPLLDQNERIIGRIFYFMDITETDKLEKRIYRAQKLALVGELAAGSAHEIRNPLAVIRGFVQIMQYSLNQEDQKKFHIPLLLQELDRINHIVEDMLLLAKPGAPQLKSMNFKGILDEILPLMESGMPPGISIQVDMDSFSVRVDPGQMKQVFHNLIRNSLEAIGQEGRIRIYSEVKHNQAHIYIEDNGCGIDPNINETLFEPFVSTKETGTGLGLTIIQQIMESHYGEIELISSSKKGTTFRITLPLSS